MTAVVSRRQLLGDLVRRLETEKVLPPELAAAQNGDTFQRGITEAVHRLPLLERLAVQRAQERAWKGLLAARKRQLATARQFFDEAAAAARDLAPEGVASAHCRSRRESAVAYLHYCQGQFDEARRALEEANAADLVLMRSGLALLHAHRAQLVHNLARSEARRGRLDLALRLAKQLIEHLLGRDSGPLPLPGPWAPALLEPCPVELAAVLIHQVDQERQAWRAT